MGPGFGGPESGGGAPPEGQPKAPTQPKPPGRSPFPEPPKDPFAKENIKPDKEVGGMREAKEPGHKPPGPGGGQFTSQGGSGGASHDDKTAEPKDKPNPLAKPRAVKGEMSPATRVGKGKDAKLVLADG